MIRFFLENLERIFGWLFQASWQASVLVALVLLIQWTFRARLNSRWMHALWLLVIARLLLPALPESALSLFQFAPPPPPVLIQSVTEPIFATAIPVLAQEPTLPPTAPPYPFSVWTALALVWLIGALSFLIVTWQVNRRFGRHVLHAPPVTDPVLLEIAAAAQAELGLHRSLRFIESAHVQGPAIMGLIYPTLILPQNVRATFTDAELRFILLHEFAHLKRGDLVLQWLVAVLQILHWFNPVLWYGFRRMRADREPATDALVLSRTNQAEQYGEVLIKLLKHYHARHALPTLVGILEDKDQFKRRFTLIGQFTRGAYGWSLLAVLLIGILAIACLTKSREAKPATFVEATGQTDDQKPGLVRIDARVVQIGEADYQAHHSEIDSAVQKGNIAPLAGLPSFNEIAELVALSQSRERIILENARLLPYPIAWDPPEKVVSPQGQITSIAAVPTDFKRQYLGVRFVTTPTLTDHQIAINGNLGVISLESWVPSKAHPPSPAFHSRYIYVNDSAASGRIRGYQLPGGAQMEPPDPSVVYLPNQTPKDPKTLARLFLFLDASAVPTASAPPVSSTNASQNPDPAAWAKLQSPAAIVDGHPIKEVEVEQQSAATEQAFKNGLSAPATTTQIDTLRQNTLDVLIDRRLILSDFKNSGGSIPDAYLDARVDDEIKARYSGSRDAFLQTLSDRKTTLDDFRQEIADNAAVQYMRHKQVVEKLSVYYQNHLDQFPADEQLNITLVTIPYQSEKLGDKEKQQQAAEKALDQIKSGADLQTVAKSFPNSLGFRDGGWLTNDSGNSLENYPTVWQALKGLKPGEVSHVIEGPWFFAIGKLNERRSPKIPATDRTAQEKSNILGAEADRLKKEWLGPLRAKAHIQYFPPYHAVASDPSGVPQAMHPDAVTTPAPLPAAETQSTTSPQRDAPELTGLKSASEGMDTDPIKPPAGTTPGITITGHLTIPDNPETIDFVESTGRLLSVVGVGYDFKFQPDGSFTIPNVQPGVYNRSLRIVKKLNVNAPPNMITEAEGQQMGAITVTAAPVQTMDLKIANPFAPSVPRGFAKIQLEVVELKDVDDSRIDPAKINAALAAGDVRFFQNLPNVDIVSLPPMLTAFGQLGVMECSRVFPYPSRFDADKNGKFIPVDFTRADLGIKARITPFHQRGKIQLNVQFSVTDFDGFATSNLGAQVPTLHTQESNILEEVPPTGEARGVSIPGTRFDEQTITDKDASGKTSSTVKVIKGRLLVFLSADTAK